MIVTFNEIKLTKVKYCKCEGCGKKLRRQRTSFQTLNPYNKNKDGSVKTETEIRVELADELDRWAKTPERCKPCEEAVDKACHAQESRQ